MRAVTIAALLLCINLAIGLVNIANDSSSGNTIYGDVEYSPDPAAGAEVREGLDDNYTNSGVLLEGDNNLLSTLKDIAKSLSTFVKFVGWSIAGIPWLLTNVFSLPVAFAYIIASPMYFIYGMALIQLIRGTGDIEN